MQKSRKDYSDEEDDRKSKKKSKKDYSDDEEDDRRSKKKKKKSSKKYDDESDEEYRSKKKSKRDDDSRSRRLQALAAHLNLRGPWLGPRLRNPRTPPSTMITSASGAVVLQQIVFWIVHLSGRSAGDHRHNRGHLQHRLAEEER